MFAHLAESSRSHLNIVQLPQQSIKVMLLTAWLISGLSRRENNILLFKKGVPYRDIKFKARLINPNWAKQLSAVFE